MSERIESPASLKFFESSAKIDSEFPLRAVPGRRIHGSQIPTYKSLYIPTGSDRIRLTGMKNGLTNVNYYVEIVHQSQGDARSTELTKQFINDLRGAHVADRSGLIQNVLPISAEAVDFGDLYSSLLNNDDDNLVDLVILAEAEDFTVEQSPNVCKRLYRFIHSKYGSEDPDILIAVCAAIRKYVSLISTEQVTELSALFDASLQGKCHLDIQLEITKMIARKYAAHPNVGTESGVPIVAKLADVADAYLNPIIITREKYGAIVMNCLIALAETDFPQFPTIVGRLRKLPLAWFQKQLTRRLRKLLESWEARPDSGQISTQIRALRVHIATCQN